MQHSAGVIFMTEQQNDNLQTYLKRGFSIERLTSYRIEGENDTAYLPRYLWNMALSKSFYPSLQSLEVAVRNSIHYAISEGLNNNFWFEDHELITKSELTTIADAKQILVRHNKSIEPGRIIAELNFGFWTALFNSRYEQILWPRFLKTAFPSMPRTLRSRANISKRLNRIRYLRNRVFHYEPIWHWHDLYQQHNEVMETLGWINPVAKELTEVIDNFQEIYQGGWESYKMEVSAIIARL
jgi:hypothetical protein